MFQSVKEVLDQFEQQKSQINFGLERMEWMLERLGHPERRLKFIHIAGTNGKGSTAAMIATVLEEAGYDVGMFTSPYLTLPNEQIRLNGKSISDDSLLRWFNHLWPYVQEMKAEGLAAPSYYELWTLAAICYFAYEGYPWFVVWETGLGGRLDATNVVHPLVTVITQIGFDHQDLLGDTITDIAKEKAAIIKSGVPVICSANNEEALSVIVETAQSKKCPLYLLNRDFSVQAESHSSKEQTFKFVNVFRTIPQCKMKLIGRHQLSNAATALMTLEILRQYYATVMDLKHLRQGLRRTFWPGRLEQVSHKPLTLLDGAHNVDSIQALALAVQEYCTYNRLILFTAMMKDKEIDKMLPIILSLADEVITTEVTNEPRSLSADDLARQIHKLCPELCVNAFSSVKAGLEYAKERQQTDDLLLVTGSLYLISEVRSLLTKN